MPEYIKVSTSAYPVYEYDIRNENPQISFGKTITDEEASALGYEVVIPITKPTGDVVTLSTPVQDGEGNYIQTWIVRNYTEAEQTMINHNAGNTAWNNAISAGVTVTMPDTSTDTFTVMTRDMVIYGIWRQQAVDNLSTSGYTQVVRSKTNVRYTLTASELIALVDDIYEGYNQIVYDSWDIMDGIA